MSKHTPGEWFTSRPNGTIYIEARIGGGMLQEVAACGPTEAPEQQEANAKLIAAAPELLSALKAVLPLVRYTDDNGWHQMKFARELVDKLSA